MKTKYLNLLCLLIINVSVLAQTRKQTINGIIKDSQNGRSEERRVGKECTG